MIKKAQKVFEPFIAGANIVTLTQLEELKGTLTSIGAYNSEIASILRAGMRHIKVMQEAGNTAAVREVVEQLAIHERVADFEKNVRSVGTHLSKHGMVVAYAMDQNRLVLRKVPKEMLMKAASDSDIPPAYVDTLSNSLHDRVLPDGEEKVLGLGEAGE